MAILDRAKVNTLYVKKKINVLVCKPINSEGQIHLNSIFSLNQNGHLEKIYHLSHPNSKPRNTVQRYTLPVTEKVVCGILLVMNIEMAKS